MEELLGDLRKILGFAQAQLKTPEDRIYTGLRTLSWSDLKRIVELGHKHQLLINVTSAGNGELVLMAVIGDTISG